MSGHGGQVPGNIQSRGISNVQYDGHTWSFDSDWGYKTGKFVLVRSGDGVFSGAVEGAQNRWVKINELPGADIAIESPSVAPYPAPSTAQARSQAEPMQIRSVATSRGPLSHELSLDTLARNIWNKIIVPWLKLMMILAGVGFILWPLSEGLGLLFKIPKAAGPEPADKSYFFDKAYRDALATILQSMMANHKSAQDLSVKTGKWWKGNVLKKLCAIGPATGCVAIYVFGMSINALFILPFAAVMLTLLVCMYDVCLAIRLRERIRMVFHGLRGKCPHAECGQSIYLPVYLCQCTSKHYRLIPNKHGIYKHQCACGRTLPATFRGRKLLPDSDKLAASCPHCEQSLLSDTGQEVAVSIGLVGAPHSGKTTYMAALAQRIMGKPSLLWSDRNVTMPDEAERLKLRSAQEAIERGGPTDKTSEDEMEAFKFDCMPRDGQALRRISLFDMSGESFRSSGSIGKHQYYGQLDGLLVLFDLDTANANAQDIQFQSIVERLIERLDGDPNVPRRRTGFGLPCAVLLSKADKSPWHDRLLVPASRKSKGKAEIEMDERCRSLLDDINQINAKNLLISRFSNIRFFAVSAYGETPGESTIISFICQNCQATFWLDGEKAGKKIRCKPCGHVMRLPSRIPINVEKPLSWLLSHHKHWS